MNKKSNIISRLVLFIISVAFILQSCDRPLPLKQVEINNISRYELNDTAGITKSILISNPSDSTVKICFSINDKIWFSNNDMINFIETLKIDSLPHFDYGLLQVFSFLYNYSSHYVQLNLADEFITNPMLLMNSIGSGLCDDRSAAFVNIATEIGFQCRIVHLGGHAVVEILNDKNWEMLDIDNGLYFVDKEDNPMSVNAISKNPNSACLKSISNHIRFNELYFLLNQSFYLDLFTTNKDNMSVIPQKIKDETEFSYLTLPKNSSIEIPVTNKLEPYSYCRIFIPAEISELINIPFAIHHIEGNGVLLSPDKIVTPKSKCGVYAPNTYFAISNGMTIVAYYNPNLIVPSDVYKVEVKSNSTSKCSVSPIKYSLVNDSIEIYGFDNLTINELESYIRFFNQTPEFIENINLIHLDDLALIAADLNNKMGCQNGKLKHHNENLNILKQRLYEKNISAEVIIKQINNAAALKVLLVALIEFNKKDFEMMVEYLCESSVQKE